jgi:hypothetical protein
MALLAKARAASSTRSSSAVRGAIAPSRVRSVVVRASETAAPEAKAAFSAPTLNPDTPSPIFGGSTGGLLRKAQVRNRIGGARRGPDPGLRLQQHPARVAGGPRPPGRTPGRMGDRISRVRGRRGARRGPRRGGSPE